MNIKTFFRIALKLIGLLLLIIGVIVAVPILFITFSINPHYEHIIVGILIAGIFLLIYGSMIFKTNWFINTFKLDQNFEEERLDFTNFKLDSLVTLMLLVLGGYFILSNIIPLLTTLYFAFSHDSLNDQGFTINNAKHILWISTLLKMLLGYVLIAKVKCVTQIGRAHV